MPWVRFLYIGAMSLVFIAAAARGDGGAAAGDIRVSDAWSRATPPGIEIGAAYFVVRNGGESDRLLQAESSVAERAELHITTTRDGVTRMRREHAVEIPSEGETAFAPGGRHVMLRGLKRPLRDGDAFPLALTFEDTGTLEVQVQVRGPGRGRHADH